MLSAVARRTTRLLLQENSRSDKRAVHGDVGHLRAPKCLVKDGGDPMGVRTVMVARL
jgi:hypothetical protein